MEKILSSHSGNIRLKVAFDSGIYIKELYIGGIQVLSDEGAFTSISNDEQISTSKTAESNYEVISFEEGLKISDITYGVPKCRVREKWHFTIASTSISWSIKRIYLEGIVVDDIAMPEWHFKEISQWTGGILGTGGVVWNKYLTELRDTYAVHTDSVSFWKEESKEIFEINVDGDKTLDYGMTFSRVEKGQLRVAHYVSFDSLSPRYQLSRFAKGHWDLFNPIELKQSEVSTNISLSTTINKGETELFPGLNRKAIRKILNTTGRYGVVDWGIVGGNGWLTNWKCLHEPFFAQMALAINDPNFTNNLRVTLDRERDLAITEKGRVLSRWHNVPEPKSNYNFETGYYEAPWGDTIDSNTGHVINVAELFFILGDLEWLKTHKQSTEVVLEWLLRRDVTDNNLYKMNNNSIHDKTCSDWLDVVWASYENAFVNAQIYQALILWSECEFILKDYQKGTRYKSLAMSLKDAFNKPLEDGGFWNSKKGHYIYWRDRDGTIHGDNLVTPVNFAAIAFDICDQPERQKIILDKIERRTSAEDLFHWPICFDSFEKEEGHPIDNWPFPKYENGDIFLTWGYLGIKSYIKYDVEIAIKYIKKLLDQFESDGLSYQRYARITQEGLGDDILAGNCTTVTALFSDIYGIKPKWNRLGLEPCMCESINGAIFNYEFRNKEFKLRLYEGSYYVKIDNYEVLSHHKFGIYVVEGALQFFPENHEKVGFELTSKKNIMVEVLESRQDCLLVAVENGRGAILTRPEDAGRMVVRECCKKQKIDFFNGVISTCIASDERTIFEFISEAS